MGYSIFISGIAGYNIILLFYKEYEDKNTFFYIFLINFLNYGINLSLKSHISSDIHPFLIRSRV